MCWRSTREGVPAYRWRTLLGGGQGVPNASRIACGRASGVGTHVTAGPWTGEGSRQSRAHASPAASPVTALWSSAVVPKAATSARRSSRTTGKAHIVTNTGARGRGAFRTQRGRPAKRPVCIVRTSGATAWRSRSRSGPAWASLRHVGRQDVAPIQHWGRCLGGSRPRGQQGPIVPGARHQGLEVGSLHPGLEGPAPGFRLGARRRRHDRMACGEQAVDVVHWSARRRAAGCRRVARRRRSSRPGPWTTAWTGVVNHAARSPCVWRRRRT
jgi:hypothetical protein